MAVSRCYACQAYAVWVLDRLVYPIVQIEILPHADMPSTIEEDFNEAALIVGMSPRGAAALLRLCIQKLMPILGEKGKNLDDDIARSSRRGWTEKSSERWMYFV